MQCPLWCRYFGQGFLAKLRDIANSFLRIPGFSVAKKGGGGTEVFYRREIANHKQEGYKCRTQRDFKNFKICQKCEYIKNQCANK